MLESHVRPNLPSLNPCPVQFKVALTGETEVQFEGNITVICVLLTIKQ